MNNTVLTDNLVAYYALKVNGKIVTPPQLSPAMLEKFKETLTSSDQLLAEVVMVTANGQEILMG